MEDLRAVLDHAGCGEVALFGISEGGPMCQLFAATHPDRVRALVLYGTYARIVEGDDYQIGIPAELPRRMARWHGSGSGAVRPRSSSSRRA